MAKGKGGGGGGKGGGSSQNKSSVVARGGQGLAEEGSGPSNPQDIRLQTVTREGNRDGAAS